MWRLWWLVSGLRNLQEQHIAFSAVTDVYSVCLSSLQFNEGEGRMHSSLEIGPNDYIVGGINAAPSDAGRAGGSSEIYSLLKFKGIKTLVYFGIAENVCVLNKAEGMRAMYGLGFEVILARDVTDAFTVGECR
eukprot:SAG31_NODE_6452_length_2013_cov_1.231975_2_plen_133_part_00